MPTFRATSPFGAVTEYDAALPNPDHLGEGWRLEELVIATPSPEEPAAPVTVYGGRRILTKLEFLQLFTQTERIAIKQAAGVSPQLDDYLYLLELADEVNLDSANTQTGVNTLGLAGILAAGRAGEILNG